MYDNSKQRSAVLPLILSTVGSVLVGMVVRRIREDRATARGGNAPRGGNAARGGNAVRGGRPVRRFRLAGKNPRGPVL